MIEEAESAGETPSLQVPLWASLGPRDPSDNRRPPRLPLNVTLEGEDDDRDLPGDDDEGESNDNERDGGHDHDHEP